MPCMLTMLLVVLGFALSAESGKILNQIHYLQPPEIALKRQNQKQYHYSFIGSKNGSEWANSSLF